MTAPNVTFWGAAHTVTGSMHHVAANGRQLLFDCGLFQGRRAEARQRNSRFPFDPRGLDAVILSHAHIDHCGNLPTLVHQGFRGSIYCTPATRDLLAVMLTDSVKIQEEDAAYLNRHRDRKEKPIEPLYTREDVHRTLRRVQPVPYERPFDLGHGMRFLFVDAGHLLGSAMTGLTIQDGANEVAITFTGDIGRRGTPILRDPAPIPPADLVITECTYGGRKHPPEQELEGTLRDVVEHTVARGGTVLVPAFSLGRTQTVIYHLHRLIQARRLPDVPIFVDSPLAAEATEVFRLHPECFDEETAQLLEDDPELFGGRRVHYTRSVEESKRLNGLHDPCVIIAASGMCESGRILHHLKHRIEDARNTILIVGYQAPNTLGHRLVERQPEVRILDRMCQLQAEVVVMNGFSSHADRDDFQALFAPLAGRTKQVRLVHGEADQAEALAQTLRNLGFSDVAVPAPGESVRVEASGVA
jgi:metallo-beta-lactamase family protein